MEITLDTMDGLPDAIKGVASPKDGKFSLDLSKLMVAEDLTGLKTALVRERENVGAYSKLGKPDEIARRIADLEATAAKGGKSGDDAQAKLDAMKLDYEGKLSDRDARIAKITGDRAHSDLKAELAKVGVLPEGLDMLAAFAAQRIKFNDDGSVKVVTVDGKPMIGSGADHGATLGDLAGELAKSMPYLVKDTGVGGGGKPAGSNGGTPGKTATRAAFDAMSQADRSAFAKTGGKVTD